MSKYVLQKSQSVPYGWVLTDTDLQIACEFIEGEFNDTQRFTPLREDCEYEVSDLARAAREMSDWLRESHYEILFSSPQRITAEGRKSVGIQIREAREEMGWTLRHLAKLTGLTHSHLSRIESGKYNLTLDTLSLIADALGRDIKLA